MTSPGRVARAALPLFALALVSLLPNPGAALPGRTYFFRDFTAAFYPLRLFTARELLAGHVPFWNPYLHEGTFAIPSFYPLDLLHALAPGPSAISWLLTLHFPLAALGFFWLARDLGLGRLGAFAAGCVYAMGGLALSSLNLYVFLQALALAPFAAAALRRCATLGRRWIPLAALAIAASVATLAMEFVAQAIVLGMALGLACVSPERRAPRVAARLGAALMLGIGLSAVPIALVRGLLPETLRGAGFVREEALRQALQPVQLLQVLVAGVLGSPDAPLSDGRVLLLFGGLPYFVTLYVGPFVLAAALAGARHPGLKRTTPLLIAAVVLGTWIALGAGGGLTPLLMAVPPFEGFRYPSKALLLPYAALAALAGAGVDRFARGQGWRALGAGALLCALVCGAAAAALAFAPRKVADALGVARELLAFFTPSAARECLLGAVLASVALALAVAARRGLLQHETAAAVFVAVLAADLARAGANVNAQTDPARLELAPEIARELAPPGRVFSYGIVGSPEYVRCATVRRRGIERWSAWVSRQVQAPYTNVIDRAEGAATPDLTALGPRVPEPTLADLEPRAVAALLPRLREAAVTRVLSLDALEDGGLRLLRAVPLGLEGLTVHVYALAGGRTREEVVCPCQASSVSRRTVSTDEVAFDVVNDAPGRLVVRDTFARGWQATADGAPVEILREGASYRAVPLPAGRHQVVLRYRPPGLRPGLAVFALAAAAAAALLLRPVL